MEMKAHFSLYQRFLGTIFVVFLILAVIEKIWLNSGLNIKIFFQLILLLLLFPIILEARKKWPKREISFSLRQYPTTHSKVIHFLLLVFSSLWRAFSKYFLYLVPLFTLGAILTHIFLLNPEGSVHILILTFFWVVSIWLCSFKGSISIAGGLMFLAMSPILLIFKTGQIAEKTAVWAYMFLLVGTIQLFVEYKTPPENVD